MVLRSSGAFRLHSTFQLQWAITTFSLSSIFSDVVDTVLLISSLSEACHTGPLMSLRCAAVSLLRTSSYSLWVSTSSLSSSSSSPKSGSTEHKIRSTVAWNATLRSSVETTQMVLKYRAQNTQYGVCYSVKTANSVNWWGTLAICLVSLYLVLAQ